MTQDDSWRSRHGDTDQGNWEEGRVAPPHPPIAHHQLVGILDDLARRSGRGSGGQGANAVVTSVTSLLRQVQDEALRDMRADVETRQRLHAVLEVLIVTVEGLIDGVAPLVFQAARATPTTSADENRGVFSRVPSWNSIKPGKASGNHTTPSPATETSRMGPAASLRDAALRAARSGLERVEAAFSRSPEPPEPRVRPWHEDDALMTLVQDLVRTARQRTADPAWAALDERLRTSLGAQGIQVVSYDPRLDVEEEGRLFRFHGTGNGPSAFEELCPAIQVVRDGVSRVVRRGDVRRLPSAASPSDGARGEREG
ncbi:hypothetical protein ACFYOA_17295 [Streptomyces iakyrus]|uniref:hypothetical protein n=1 Tax=Streptomyces iakyrus TaxID=68219 RepID=UPI003691CBB8